MRNGREIFIATQIRIRIDPGIAPLSLRAALSSSATTRDRALVGTSANIDLYAGRSEARQADTATEVTEAPSPFWRCAGLRRSLRDIVFVRARNRRTRFRPTA